MENKTQKTKKAPLKFLKSVKSEKRKSDSIKLFQLLNTLISEKPAVWGDSMIGYGDYEYKYSSGKTGVWFLIGFSPRVQSLVLYLMDGTQHHSAALKELALKKPGKSCVYIKDFDKLDKEKLSEMILASYENIKAGKIEY